MNNTCVDYCRTIMRLKLEKFLAYNLKMDYCPEVDGEVVIYGAGELGKLAALCFEKKPSFFIDVKKGLNDIGGIPVYCLKECSKELLNGIGTVIITPIWSYEEICREIIKLNSETNVISLEKLVEKL